MNKNFTVMLMVLALPVFVYGLFYGNSVGLFTAGTESSGTNYAPSLSLSSSADGNFVTIKASAIDDNGVKSVSIFIDGSQVKICNYDNVKEVTCEYSIDSLGEGQYTYKARAFDGEKTVASLNQIIEVQ